MQYEKVVVTGGTSFAGKRLRLVKPDWIYLSSKQVNLESNKEFYNFLMDTKPDAVIHLAAKTGGIKDNVENQSDFYYYNSLLNLNVLKQSQAANIKRVLSSLSTCCYPDVSDRYPMLEEDILNGEPTPTNYGYALAKRELYRQNNFYRRFYNLNYSTFTPCNLYGPQANFDDGTSHFIASLLKKIYFAKNNSTIELYGTGNAMRQHLYIDDLAKIIPILLEQHNSDIPINVTPSENVTIKNISELAIKISQKNINIFFNNKLEGQLRKDVDNIRLLNILNEFTWTSLENGLKQTYDWFVERNS